MFKIITHVETWAEIYTSRSASTRLRDYVPSRFKKSGMLDGYWVEAIYQASPDTEGRMRISLAVIELASAVDAPLFTYVISVAKSEIVTEECKKLTTLGTRESRQTLGTAKERWATVDEACEALSVALTDSRKGRIGSYRAIIFGVLLAIFVAVPCVQIWIENSRDSRRQAKIDELSQELASLDEKAAETAKSYKSIIETGEQAKQASARLNQMLKDETGVVAQLNDNQAHADSEVSTIAADGTTAIKNLKATTQASVLEIENDSKAAINERLNKLTADFQAKLPNVGKAVETFNAAVDKAVDTLKWQMGPRNSSLEEIIKNLQDYEKVIDEKAQNVKSTANKR